MNDGSRCQRIQSSSALEVIAMRNVLSSPDPSSRVPSLRGRGVRLRISVPVSRFLPVGLPAGLLAGLLAGLMVAGCASSRPVLYGGGQVADQDIEDCMRLAREAGADANRGGQVAKDTATGAAMGAATTGVYGAVRGESDIANRAAAGAAAGAAVGLIRGGVRASEPSDTLKRYVNRCLRERGYDVVGWN
jgi:hypothetical protein